jgi:alpha-tubulin suppressor-like RCC1 family protein
VNGRSSTCGITTTGTVKCWGFNYNGQVGPNGSGTFVLAPVDVPGIQNAISVACGWDACYAATGGTQIMAWGANNLGQLGNGTTGTGGPTPVSVVW